MNYERKATGQGRGWWGNSEVQKKFSLKMSIRDPRKDDEWTTRYVNLESRRRFELEICSGVVST